MLQFFRSTRIIWDWSGQRGFLWRKSELSPIQRKGRIQPGVQVVGRVYSKEAFQSRGAGVRLYLEYLANDDQTCLLAGRFVQRDEDGEMRWRVIRNAGEAELSDHGVWTLSQRTVTWAGYFRKMVFVDIQCVEGMKSLRVYVCICAHALGSLEARTLVNKIVTEVWIK